MVLLERIPLNTLAIPFGPAGLAERVGRGDPLVLAGRVTRPLGCHGRCAGVAACRSRHSRGPQRESPRRATTSSCTGSDSESWLTQAAGRAAVNRHPGVGGTEHGPRSVDGAPGQGDHGLETGLPFGALAVIIGHRRTGPRFLRRSGLRRWPPRNSAARTGPKQGALLSVLTARALMVVLPGRLVDCYCCTPRKAATPTYFG
jgi:hypothetical protein